MGDSKAWPTIRISENGPLIVTGTCDVVGPGGRWRETRERFALCRCGASSCKPFCDNTHVAIGFSGELADDPRQAAEPGREPRDGRPAIKVVRNGPYVIEGGLKLVGVEPEPDGRYRLCGCGRSRSKPYCDDSHLIDSEGS